MIDIATALISLRPNADWGVSDDVIEWLDTEQTRPTDAEITTEITRLQSEYDANDYARQRKAKYDALNQFELISDDSINGTTTHKDAILAIKAEIPKPTA
jgi:hypothetical protein